MVSATTLAVALIGVAGCTDETSQPAATPTRTTTTMVAGAGVIGNDRRPDESCAAEPARPDPGPPNRSVHNFTGVEPPTVEVPEDAQRIVVLSGDQLDALCALGLQSRVVGAALPDGSETHPA